MTTRPPPRGRGFTLIELMLVVALVAVLLMLAAPSMREMIEMRRLRGVTAQVVTDLQYARSEAVARRTLLRVWLQEDADTTCYTMYTAATTAAVERCDCLRGEGSACPAGSVEVKTVSLARSQGVTVTTPEARKAFAYEPTLGALNAIPIDKLPFPMQEYAIDLKLSSERSLRVELTRNGRPKVCAPPGSTVAETSC